MDSRSSVSGVYMAVYSYCIAWAHEKERLYEPINFGGADNAKKGEQAYNFLKVWVQFIEKFHSSIQVQEKC